MTNRYFLRLSAGIVFAALWSSWTFGAGNNAALTRDIENNLIAPCCWTQPISEHESSVSEQMRQEVRAMVAEGKSRDEILDYYVAKYGERVLATPRARGVNLLAYIVPWSALILGGCGLFILLRKQRVSAPITAPDAPETAPDGRYDAIIDEELKKLDNNPL